MKCYRALYHPEAMIPGTSVMYKTFVFVAPGFMEANDYAKLALRDMGLDPFMSIHIIKASEEEYAAYTANRLEDMKWWPEARASMDERVIAASDTLDKALHTSGRFKSDKPNFTEHPKEYTLGDLLREADIKSQNKASLVTEESVNGLADIILLLHPRASSI